MAASPTTSISFQNFFQATLSSSCTATDTDIFLDTVPNGTEGFLVIDPDSTTNREVIYYNSKTATKVICPSVADGRGQDDTTATAHEQGTTVIMAPIAAYFETLLSLFTTTPQGWTSLSGTFTSPTYNGNRSYTVSTSVDQTSILNPGNRLRVQRTVAAPTTVFSLDGSNDYYNKTSPAGMTFTDDFVVSAWIRLTSYTGTKTIVSRYNGTSGWCFYVDANGLLTLAGFNGGAGNYSVVTSYQSVPLNKWVHVTGQLDMSSFTATSTTSYFMMDGVDIPANVARAGTNPTALVQAGNLEIGSRNTTDVFPGYITDVMIFNAKVTQATMRTYMGQKPTGSETSLISAYSNGSTTDLNTGSANNLTAQNGATTSSSYAPYTVNSFGTPGGTYDYAIVTAVTASTITLQMPEGCALPLSGGISGMSYSNSKSPYGFPAAKGRWEVNANFASNVGAISISSLNQWFSTLAQITVPVGDWDLGYQMTTQYAGATKVTQGSVLLAPATPTNAVRTYDLTYGWYSENAAQTGYIHTFKKDAPVSLSSATAYIFYSEVIVNSGATTSGVRGDLGLSNIKAVPSHL